MARSSLSTIGAGLSHIQPEEEVEKYVEFLAVHQQFRSANVTAEAGITCFDVYSIDFGMDRTVIVVITLDPNKTSSRLLLAGPLRAKAWHKQRSTTKLRGASPKTSPIASLLFLPRSQGGLASG